MRPNVTTLKELSFLSFPFLYFFIGTFITIELLKIMLSSNSIAYQILLIPMTLLTILLTVIGIVNVWIQYRSIKHNWVHNYGVRELLWLYFRCWFVTSCGITLSVVFYLLHDLIPQDIQSLVHNLYIFFYIICAFLTIAALASIILREDLNEIRLINSENENQLLKAQLNPHFLYNTLNNIDALVWLDQERASQAVTRLSDLMRYLTYSSKKKRTAIEEEVNHLIQFIDLQRLRVSNANALSFHVDIDDGQQTIAPLLMIPLVENCFKHCGDIDEDNAITIRLSLKQGEMVFSTDNNLPVNNNSLINKTKGGIGLEVLRRRLSLLYSDRYSLLNECKDGRYLVVLCISL